jgi:hypothetical protein
MPESQVLPALTVLEILHLIQHKGADGCLGNDCYVTHRRVGVAAMAPEMTASRVKSVARTTFCALRRSPSTHDKTNSMGLWPRTRAVRFTKVLASLSPAKHESWGPIRVGLEQLFRDAVLDPVNRQGTAISQNIST